MEYVGLLAYNLNYLRKCRRDSSSVNAGSQHQVLLFAACC